MKRLEHDIISGDVHHAYLFSGPAEIGKTVVAKAFASYLQSGISDSAEVSEAISRASHPDTFFYSADEGTFKVAQVREITEKLSRSFSSLYHVCIIENIERMTVSASNALLKILEEPPRGTVFILISEKVNKLLPTIVSRTRVVRFSDISRQTLLHYLEGLDEPRLSVKQIETMLDLSDGKMGRIFRFIHQPEYFDEYSRLYDSVLQCLKSEDIVTRFRFVEDLLKSEDPTKTLNLFFQALSHIVRVMTHEKVVNNEAWGVRDLYESLERSRRLICETNVNKRLLLENLMLAL